MILERYLLRETVRTFAAVFAILLSIYIASRFVRYLADAAAGELQRGLILEMLTLKLFTSLQTLLPLCLFLATFLSVNRLQRDNEITAISNTGLGRSFLLNTAAKLAIAVAVPLGFATLFLMPRAEARLIALETRAERESDVMGISAGRFKELSRGNRIIYVRSLSDDREMMEGVFLQAREADRQGVLSSAQARMEKNPETGDRYVIFLDGNRYDGTPGGLEYTITHFERYTVRLERNDEAPQQLLKAAPVSVLWAGESGMHAAELQWRIVPFFSTLLLSLLAVLLVRPGRGLGRYSGLFSAILAYFVYSNMLGVARSMLKKETIPPYIGLWWVHLLLAAVIAGVLLYPVWRRRVLRNRARAAAAA